MFAILRQFFVLAILTGLGATVSVFTQLAPVPWAEPEILPGQIRLEDAKALEVIWLDARDRQSYETSHIPGAMFYDQEFPIESIALLFPIWIEKQSPIVVYCSDKNCGTSESVASFLRENFPDAEIYTLEGGWQAWEN